MCDTCGCQNTPGAKCTNCGQDAVNCTCPKTNDTMPVAETPVVEPVVEPVIPTEPAAPVDSTTPTV